MSTNKEESVGVVKTKYADFESLKLESGETLSPLRLAYETYGKLNRKKSNAILVFHALSGDQHAAGKHRKNARKNGWYDIAIGPGKTFDTGKYFVICANVIGGCGGSTGPSSINPQTGREYALDFPDISIKDMVAAQKKLADFLGITRLYAVAGASMGGMQALQWAIDYPGTAERAIVIASAAKQYPMGIAFHEVGRQAIINDPDWNNGDYYGGRAPESGLSVARQVAHITYLSQQQLERKFDRRKKRKKPSDKFGAEFEIQGYLRYKGKSFVRRFDANTYLYITRAIDRFDLTKGGRKRLEEAFEGVKTRFLVVSIESDWLYPPEHVEEVYAGLAGAGVPVAYRRLDLPYGHDAFLIYNNTLGNTMTEFLGKA